jgi:hypothetical protein
MVCDCLNGNKPETATQMQPKGSFQYLSDSKGCGLIGTGH